MSPCAPRTASRLRGSGSFYSSTRGLRPSLLLCRPCRGSHPAAAPAAGEYSTLYIVQCALPCFLRRMPPPSPPRYARRAVFITSDPTQMPRFMSPARYRSPASREAVRGAQGGIMPRAVPMPRFMSPACWRTPAGAAPGCNIRSLKPGTKRKEAACKWHLSVAPGRKMC